MKKATYILILFLTISLLMITVVFAQADVFITCDPQPAFNNDSGVTGYEISWDGGSTWEDASFEDQDGKIKLKHPLS